MWKKRRWIILIKENYKNKLKKNFIIKVFIMELWILSQHDANSNCKTLCSLSNLFISNIIVSFAFNFPIEEYDVKVKFLMLMIKIKKY